MTQDEYNTKLLVDLNAGIGPDIFAPTESTLIKFIRAKSIVPVPANVGEFVKAQAMNKGVLDAVSGPDGTIYGIPYFGDWPAMFYNADMYKEAGISRPPATWDELVDTARKLTKRDAAGSVAVSGFFVRKSGAQLGTFEKWYPFFAANGGRLFDAGMTKSIFNSPEGVQALQFYVDLMYTHKVDSFDAPKGDTDGFIGGNVAQYIREPDNIAAFQSEAPSLRFGTAVIPNGKAKARGMATITPIVVSSGSKNQRAAFDLLMWLSSSAIDARRCQALQMQPVLKSTAAASFYKENALLQPFLQQEADIFPFHLKSHEMEIVIGKYVETALHRGMTPKEALDQAAKEVDELLRAQ